MTIFTSNFIGVVFARTLHYQFYCWYFHTIPYLLWHTSIPLFGKLAVLGGIEYAFNVFPATPLSSAVLQVYLYGPVLRLSEMWLLQMCHILLLVALWISPMPPPILGAETKTLPGISVSSKNESCKKLN